MTPQLWTVLFVALIGAVTGVLSYWRGVKTDRADIAGKYEIMASKQADQIEQLRADREKDREELRKLKDDFIKLQDENTQLYIEIENLKSYNEKLIAFIERNGLKPPPHEPLTKPKLPRSLE